MNKNGKILETEILFLGNQLKGKMVKRSSRLLKDLHAIFKSMFIEFLAPKIKPLLFIGIILSVFQQITGINTIMYYAPKIFTNVGQSYDSALFQTILINNIMLSFKDNFKDVNRLQM